MSDAEAAIELDRNPEFLRPDANTIAILNFGSQHTLEILDSVKHWGVNAVVLPANTPADQLSGCGGIILSGGPNSVHDDTAVEYDPAVMDIGKPIMGICYGAQLVAQHFGGKVVPGKSSEFGQYVVERQTNPDPKLKPLGVFASGQSSQSVWMNHGDRITEVPVGFHVDAISHGGVIAGFSDQSHKIIGLQFHPEVNGKGRTELGLDIFASFLFDVANMKPTIGNDTLEQMITDLKTQIGDRHVLMFLSGGVDSTVMAKLVLAGVDPKQIHAVLIDHGFMRLGEPEKVQADLAKVGIDVSIENAHEYFMGLTTTINNTVTTTLRHSFDPEVKRKIIGDGFIRIQKIIAEKQCLPDDYLLCQGSIRPDLIESGSHGGDTIKTHHNDSPLARELRKQGRVIEPMANYYKPGVRALGKQLGLPQELLLRQPFPGPGLAIRILAESGVPMTTAELDELKWLQKSVGAFATKSNGVHVIPVRSVGQEGDGRRYGLTAVVTGQQDWMELMRLAREIPANVRGITRVVYAFDIKPTSGLKRYVQAWNLRNYAKMKTPTELADPLRPLQKADEIVREEVTAVGLDSVISQFPVIAVPHGVDKPDRRSLVLRPFDTHNFMTGRAIVPGMTNEQGAELLPQAALRRIVDRLISEVSEFNRVLIDLTGKPPGTTEWE